MRRDGVHTSKEALPPRVPVALAKWLLWAGALACIAGLALHRIWESWRPGRLGELLLVSLIAGALAWLPRRAMGLAWASGLALVWLAALALFAGPLAVLAGVLVGAAAAALGGALLGRGPLAVQCAAGLTLLAGVLGWLLPLPLHGRWSYLALCVACIAWRRGALLESLRAGAAHWQSTVAAAPRAAAWAVLAVGLATSACWLPTLQVDDLGYHLRLPWQLQMQGRYEPDPWLHAWALAPWASDIQHALLQLLAGGEARGALNALWIALTAAGLWRLCHALGGTARDGWMAIALYASLPLTAALAAGMQTENATTALVVWLAWLILERDVGASGMGRLRAGAVLFGGLIALKLIAALQALVLLAWALVAGRHRAPLRQALPAIALAVVVAGSSYAYAAAIAGNPFLPLFNAWFQSPYFADVNFEDARWRAGWSPALAWRTTFASADYYEGFAGAAGFTLIALAGACVLALWHDRTRAVTLAGVVMLAATLLPVQYLRYAFPALVLLLPGMVLAARRTSPRHATALLAAVCVLNFAFQSNANWMVRTGALKQTVLAWGADRPLFLQYAPERVLLAELRTSAAGNALALDTDKPWVAELGSRGRMLAWYAPMQQRDAFAADNDATGTAWMQFLHDHRISEVVVRPHTLTPARSAALARMGASPRARAGDVQLWHVPQRLPSTAVSP